MILALGQTYARHPLPVLGQGNEAARVHHASSCRGWDLAVGAGSIPSNDNSLMRQRHFARRLLSLRVNTQAHDDSCANYSAPGEQEQPDREVAS
jgi:hypothetical protein